jgi:Pilus formation protein N terminal region
MTASYVRGRAASRSRWLLASMLLFAVAAPVLAAEPIVVNIDQATIVALPTRAKTLVIGNPLIADISLVHGKDQDLAVVTGKGYGATNVIAWDGNGIELLKKTVEVTGPSDRIVVVYRGVTRETYSCTPECSRRITLGDFPDYFDKTLGETTLRDTQASGLSAASGTH